MPENEATPRAAGSRRSAPAGGATASQNQQVNTTVDEALQKVISDDVAQLIKDTLNSIKGQEFTTIAEAVSAAGGDDPFFNPTLSQYKKDMYLYFDPANMGIKKVPVGKSGTKAWALVVPAGHYDQHMKKVVLDRVFQAFLNTFRKQILVTDELGDQVLDENREPVIRDGKGNNIWEEARKCGNSADLMEYVSNLGLTKVDDIVRDFGPSVFVPQQDGTRKATSHKMTSLPLFIKSNDPIATVG